MIEAALKSFDLAGTDVNFYWIERAGRRCGAKMVILAADAPPPGEPIGAEQDASGARKYPTARTTPRLDPLPAP